MENSADGSARGHVALAKKTLRRSSAEQLLFLGRIGRQALIATGQSLSGFRISLLGFVTCRKEIFRCPPFHRQLESGLVEQGRLS